jgi:rhodanese-related sulfurtransferase
VKRTVLVGLGRTPSLLALIALAVCTGCAEKISRADLASRIADGSAPPIVDVRSGGEYAESHVPGAVHVPFYSMLSRSEELPSREGEPLVVYCEHGPRAGLARAGLWLAGAGEVRFLEGHMIAWKEDGLPVESGAPDPSEPGGVDQIGEE